MSQPIRDGDDLMLNIGRLPAGSPARITLERGGRVFQRQVTLAKFPVQGKVVVTKPGPNWRGLTVDYATACSSISCACQFGRGPGGSLRDRARRGRGEPGLGGGPAARHADQSCRQRAAWRRPTNSPRRSPSKEGDVMLRLAPRPARPT